MSQTATVRSLQQRIAEMQPLRLDERALPTPPQLREFLPGGALRAGAATTVQGSLQLALALTSAISASGGWCGAIGVPELGFESAESLGLALDRFIVVPDPGPHALGIAATLSEVLTAIVLRPPTEPRAGDAARLAAKLRDHSTALVALGPWPGTECKLTAVGSRWTGLGRGHGLLDTHELIVESEDRRGRLRHTVRFKEGRLEPC